MYGDHVLDVEYSDDERPFAENCADPDAPHAVVLRDRALTTPDDPAYVFATCD